MRFSQLAQSIQTSPIITLAAEINEKIQSGERFFNLTIGDFNPQIFPIPEEMKREIVASYHAGNTNYPGAAGSPVLRQSVSRFLQHFGDLRFAPDDILIASGGRPLLYAAYRTIVDPDDRVIFPVPSWNNDYYTELSGGQPVIIETRPEDNFMPTAAAIRPHLKDASLVSLCSPLNPTGTTLSREGLEEICDMILEENQRRGDQRKPVYLIFDQIYWLLTFGETHHYNPVALRPAMREYTICVEGISKAFAGTGVRVGWAFGPTDIIRKMRTIIAHMGAWAPKPEQVAVGNYLADPGHVQAFLEKFRKEIEARLQGFYRGFCALRNRGYRVNAIKPQAAIYLTVQLDLCGARTANDQVLQDNHAVHRYILDHAKIGLVPFSYFGAPRESSWYRLSVGTCRLEEVELIMTNLEKALSALS